MSRTKRRNEQRCASQAQAQAQAQGAAIVASDIKECNQRSERNRTSSTAQLRLRFGLSSFSLGAFLAALTKQVKCSRRPPKIDRQCISVADQARQLPFLLMICKFSNMHLLLLLLAAAWVRCAMINCCRYTQSSSLRASQLGRSGLLLPLNNDLQNVLFQKS